MTAPKPKATPADTYHRLALAIRAAGGSADIDIAGLAPLIDLVSRIDTKHPAANDVFDLERLLAAQPGLWRVTADLASRAIDEMIDRMQARPSVKVSLRHAAAELRTSVAGSAPSPLEAVLAEQIAVNWIRVRIFDLLLNDAVDSGEVPTIRFWEARAASAQARLLASCESLARIRRLAILTPQLFQINVGRLDPPAELPALPGARE